MVESTRIKEINKRKENAAHSHDPMTSRTWCVPKWIHVLLHPINTTIRVSFEGLNFLFFLGARYCVPFPNLRCAAAAAVVHAAALFSPPLLLCCRCCSHPHIRCCCCKAAVQEEPEEGRQGGNHDPPLIFLLLPISLIMFIFLL